MMDYITAILSSYILTLVITKGSIFANLRNWIKTKTLWLSIAGQPHMIECRLCLGAWVSLITSLFIFHSLFYWLPIWGASYFMATQERG